MEKPVLALITSESKTNSIIMMNQMKNLNIKNVIQDIPRRAAPLSPSKYSSSS
jgi:Trk K+ transport system NAD-binding subunit